MARRCDLTNKNVQFGNNVSHAQNKSRRRFNVNLHNVTLTSAALKQGVKLKIAVSTLRTVDHNGGLDNYLLTTSNTKLTNKAIALKKKIKKAIEEQNAPKESKAEAA